MKDNSVHPISSQVKLSYNGNDFLLDIAEGNMISLNAIYEIAGSPENKQPYEWKRLPQTQELLTCLAFLTTPDPSLKRRGEKSISSVPLLTKEG